MMGRPGRVLPGQSPGRLLRVPAGKRAWLKGLTTDPLLPRRFPSLAPRYRESATAGNDVFHRFSAFIKNPVPTQDDGEEGQERGEGGGSWPRPGLTAPPPRPQPCTSCCCAPSPGWTATCARRWSTSWCGNRSLASRAAASWTATSSRWLTVGCCPSCTSWT